MDNYRALVADTLFNRLVEALPKDFIIIDRCGARPYSIRISTPTQPGVLSYEICGDGYVHVRSLKTVEIDGVRMPANVSSRFWPIDPSTITALTEQAVKICDQLDF